MNRRELLRLLSVAGTLVALPRIEAASDIGWATEGLEADDVEQSAAMNAHLWQVYSLSTSKRLVYPLVRQQLGLLTDFRAFKQHGITTVRGRMVSDEPGRIFREAWIAGVKKHYPGEPKPGYIAPWDETPDWERQSAAAVYTQVRDFIRISDGNTARLNREQKGRFVALCWIAQIYKHIPDPKPSYVADWNDLPGWQRETDADIFERVELER